MQPRTWCSIKTVTASFIRADFLVSRAVADAKIFSGRGSKYYDPTVAAGKMTEFKQNWKIWKIEITPRISGRYAGLWIRGGRVGFGPGSFYGQTSRLDSGSALKPRLS